MTIRPVILCGGSCSRLWPLSREHYPKPLLKMTSGQPLGKQDGLNRPPILWYRKSTNYVFGLHPLLIAESYRI